jgi:hypothetical protein
MLIYRNALPEQLVLIEHVALRTLGIDRQGLLKGLIGQHTDNGLCKVFSAISYQTVLVIDKR